MRQVARSGRRYGRGRTLVYESWYPVPRHLPWRIAQLRGWPITRRDVSLHNAAGVALAFRRQPATARREHQREAPLSTSSPFSPPNNPDTSAASLFCPSNPAALNIYEGQDPTASHSSLPTTQASSPLQNPHHHGSPSHGLGSCEYRPFLLCLARADILTLPA